MTFLYRVLLPALLLALQAAPVRADPQALLRDIDDSAHVQRVDMSEETVVDHEIGLDAMHKVRGVWRFETSERVSGRIQRYTWQITDGFTSIEVMQTLLENVEALEGSSLLFACDGRACGHSAQWANRVFGQRVLYGRQDLQRYRVYTLLNGGEYRLMIYASARTADRQYLQANLLRVDPQAE